MKIIMFSMTPLFPNKSMGGAQKQLKKVALYLAESGHEVTILCTRREDAASPFYWHDNLRVVPLYRFKQPFPEPYATHVFNIASAIQDTGDYLRGADVFYNHDGGLLFPYIYQDIPAVISLRSIIFSETLQSGYLFQGDALILPSEHTARAWQATVGRFFPDLADRTHVVYNGLDWSAYHAGEPSAELAAQIGVNPTVDDVMLYPHRPEEPKGIRRTIAVVDLLVNQLGFDRLKVLVPRWIDTGLSADVRAFYTALADDIDNRGLTDHFIFHDWINDTQMPDYFRLGHVTVALGNYVETFGNTPYESLACGTPVVAARVGPYRDMLPEDFVSLVDYGDDEAAAHHIARILTEKERPSAAVSTWLKQQFDQQQMVERYADIILNAKKQAPMPYVHRPFTDQTRFILAPWCFIGDRGIYHDFDGLWLNDPNLQRALNAKPNGITFDDINETQLMIWYRNGYLVPVYT